MKTKIGTNAKKQLVSFIQSPVFSEKNEIAYSDYWKNQSELIKVKITSNDVHISGNSGFYVPEATIEKTMRRARKALFSPDEALNSISERINGYFKRPRYLTRAEAFDKTMRNDPICDPDLSPFRVNHFELS